MIFNFLSATELIKFLSVQKMMEAMWKSRDLSWLMKVVYNLELHRQESFLGMKVVYNLELYRQESFLGDGGNMNKDRHRGQHC